MWACDPAIVSSVVGSYQTALPVFAQALQTFIAAQCALTGDHLWPEDAIQAVLKDPNYDFIVVGAGTAGSVVANRLSEVPDWKVLLIEAGGNPTLATEIPQIYFNVIESPQDWGYRNQPQEGSCRSYKTKSCSWPRGKVLGGTSSMNGLAHVRGNKKDYDEWSAAGNKGWSYEEVLPYFIKSENFTDFLTEDFKKYHGSEGYLHVEKKNDAHEFENLVLQAVTELGLKHQHDVNGASQMGVTKFATTTKNGVRQSSARAFLSPIKDRRNLHVIKNAHVKKVLFKSNSNVVSGVLVHKDGKDIIINAKKEVISSAGAINSPQLLMLSGIGPRNHLEELGIEVKADLPVGENLQEHLYVPVYFRKPGDKNLNSMPNIVAALSQYMFENDGAFASTAPSRVISFINTTDSDAVSPDVQHHYVFLPPNVANSVDFYGNQGFSEEFQKKFREFNKEHFVFFTITVLLQPKSIGKIVLKSSDPFEYPLIYANYFEKEEDRKTLLRGIKQHSMKLAETKAFRDAGFQLEWIELDACRHHKKNTDEFFRCWTTELTTSLYHPTSTVKMGPDSDESAVVDNELKVKKVKGLRVIDASIMPKAVRGNPNAAIIMIGEKGADMIKKFWMDVHTEL